MRVLLLAGPAMTLSALVSMRVDGEKRSTLKMMIAVISPTNRKKKLKVLKEPLSKSDLPKCLPETEQIHHPFKVQMPPI